MRDPSLRLVFRCEFNAIKFCRCHVIDWFYLLFGHYLGAFEWTILGSYLCCLVNFMVTSTVSRFFSFINTLWLVWASDVNKDLKYKAKDWTHKAKDLTKAITQGQGPKLQDQGHRIDMNKTQNGPYVSVYWPYFRRIVFSSKFMYTSHMSDLAKTDSIRFSVAILASFLCRISVFSMYRGKKV